ncbi:hypothetical protein FIA58_009600 [Flavobacterium jejuense]|uniref:DUF1735 domain-containing protein n=1 Tax=Flavobacterium jejuense TaxID=1544455 RepID=A0ABX0IQF4_9FLAO|nr:hypothetical protein [Flavobacterium jejuense]NHN25928.1 hypothetical protein [Flavobacterium jejuense]
MKNKLFISGLFFILYLTSSCSTDAYYEFPEEKNVEFTTPSDNTIPFDIKVPSDVKTSSSATMKEEVYEVNVIMSDSTFVPPTNNGETPSDGEPSNPKPPRNG